MTAYVKAQTILKVDHVSLSFGDKIVLRDVDAEVQDIERADSVVGQVIAFLGPSGIGKSSLARIMTGLLSPTSGRVLVQMDGHPTMEPVQKGQVGMVFQRYPLFDFATVEGNLWIAGKQAGWSEAHLRALVADYVAQFSLEPYLKMYPCQLSGGTRQRVAIVRQLMCSGHYLVMDEPFSGLDPIMKQKACALITQVANRDTLNTIIVVTHDIVEGLSVADTVWLMGREPGLPGARLVKQYDLAEKDLCWHPDIQQDVRFQEFVATVKADFRDLV